jgi:hypothetical protein
MKEMASQLSKDVATNLFTNGFNQAADRLELIKNPETYLGGWNFLAVASVVDAELAEVREVLESLAWSSQYCWCPVPVKTETQPHSAICQRARALYDKLEVK